MKINSINSYSYVAFSSKSQVKQNSVRTDESTPVKENINKILDELMFLDEEKGDFDRYLDKRTSSSDYLLSDINYELSPLGGGSAIRYVVYMQEV